LTGFWALDERKASMFKRLLLLASLFLGWATSVSAESLAVGDAAPKLEVKEFIKGDPVQDLEKGKTYVLVFWGAWCHSCRTTLPPLSDLQKKYKDVIFLAVSVYEPDQKNVRTFVDSMGDKMDFRVALDAVPATGRSVEGKMATTWLQAAGEEGIPTAFLVNSDGKIAWIGPPQNLEQPLAQIVEGKFDLAAAIKAQGKEAQADLRARRRKVSELQAELAKVRGDDKAVLEVLDKLFAEDPAQERVYGFQKFAVLTGKNGDPEKALDYGQHLVETNLKNAQGLNFLAWTIVDPQSAVKPDAKLAALALRAVLLADELTQSKDPAISDTLAAAYFVTGDAEKALAAQERAVELAKGTQYEKDPSLKARLEQYRQAVKK
jgi:thiol-disulfide isomerase/thioredoxin